MAARKDIHSVLLHVLRTTGFDARGYRRSTLKRRLARRMAATGSATCGRYLDYLKRHPEEREKFLESLSVGVSEFFRDRRVFHTLKNLVLPGIIDRISAQKRKTIRVWSIGCSRGQEPFSLAMLFRETLRERTPRLKVHIHASDFHRPALVKAKKATYRKDELHQIPRKMLTRYFEKADGQGFRPKQEIRNMVTFHLHDFINGSSLGTFDLIFCRNVFIFFEPRLQEKLIWKIHRSLKKDGVLVLGTSEFPRQDGLFTCLSSRDRVYRKIG